MLTNIKWSSVIALVVGFIILISALLFKFTIATKVTVGDGEDVIEYTELYLVLEDEYREYQNIRTYTFDVQDSRGKSSKLSDGLIKIETIQSVLNAFLDENKYNTRSIGFIGNKFYIQQDMNNPIHDKDIELYILSLGKDFTTNDWFGMTEAVLANAEVLSDTVFNYTTDVGDRHYMYVCTREIN